MSHLRPDRLPIHPANPLFNTTLAFPRASPQPLTLTFPLINDLRAIPLHSLPRTTQLPQLLLDIYPIVVHPAFPFVIATSYLLIVNALSRLQDGRNRIRSLGKLGTVLVTIHNAVLAIYSAWSFIGTGPLIARALWRGASSGWDGFKWALCDADGAIWHEALGDYTYVFYLSKAWEFLDTAILLLKGKRPEVLQTFHHAGAIIGTWAGVRYQTSPVWLFVVFNSLVHAFMYTYFTLATMGFRIPRLLKQTMTTMQITQFLLGLALSLLYPIVRIPDTSPFTGAARDFGRNDRCLRDAGQSFGFWFSDGYVVVLTVLFYAFYQRTYQPSQRARSKAAIAGVKEASGHPTEVTRRYNLRQRNVKQK